MSWEIVLLIGVMFSVAAYLLLDTMFTNVVLGLVILSNAVNILLLAASKNPNPSTLPILDDTNQLTAVDPLPQALILTAIVIGFGILSFFAVTIYQVFGSLDTENLITVFRRKK